MTVGFIALAVVVLISAFFADAAPATRPAPDPGHSPLVAVALAFPVAMALATGIEAPSSAIAQLGQLDDPGRRRFGRVTLWLTLGVVGTITLGLTAQAVRLGIGVPHQDTTQIAELARAATTTPVFAAFQLTTALLLLSAASSSFQAGPGLFKALARQPARRRHEHRDPAGVAGPDQPPPHAVLGRGGLHGRRRARHGGRGGRDQELVLFYAASVFVSFLAGLLAMARFSWRERRITFLVINFAGALAVGFTLAVNLTRGDPIVSIAAALLIAAALYWLWVRSGRPRGIRNIAADAEE